MIGMAFQKGDFIQIDYIAKVKETNEVFDTTKEDIAKKERLYKEGEIYEPKLVVIGEGWVLKTLDEKLPTMEVGKEATVEIPPDKAFGNRDAQKVRRVPLRQLLARDITPTLGLRIEYGGKMATVRAIGAGRVLQLTWMKCSRGNLTKTGADHTSMERHIERKRCRDERLILLDVGKCSIPCL